VVVENWRSAWGGVRGIGQVRGPILKNIRRRPDPRFLLLPKPLFVLAEHSVVQLFTRRKLAPLAVLLKLERANFANFEIVDVLESENLRVFHFLET
jgi:hypothetical protein